MAQKKETSILILSLLITLGLLAPGGWLAYRYFNNDSSSNPSPTPSPTPPSSATGKAGTFSAVSNVPEGLFNYGGSTTWAPIRDRVDSVIPTVWPKFQLRYVQHPTKSPGSGTGIAMLLDNQLAFSQSSRSVKDSEYQQAQEKGFTLREIPIAIDAIAIAVHPDLEVEGLTVAELQEIYIGQVTNWSQVGGPDLPITPYSRSVEAGGTVEFFVDNILGGEDFGLNVELIPTTTQALRKVAENLGGIYFASAPEVVPQCGVKSLPIGLKSDELVPPYQEPFVPLDQCPNPRNQVNSQAIQTGDYPITRRLFVIVREDGQIDQQAGEAYAELLLTDTGQELIEKAGFIDLR